MVALDCPTERSATAEADATFTLQGVGAGPCTLVAQGIPPLGRGPAKVVQVPEHGTVSVELSGPSIP